VFPERPVQVKFAEISRNWVVGDDASVQMFISKGTLMNPFDWLGLFRVSIQSANQQNENARTRIVLD
jgi:hypothetical protein